MTTWGYGPFSERQHRSKRARPETSTTLLSQGKPSFPGSSLTPDRMQTESLIPSNNGRFMEVGNRNRRESVRQTRGDGLYLSLQFPIKTKYVFQRTDQARISHAL